MQKLDMNRMVLIAVVTLVFGIGSWTVSTAQSAGTGSTSTAQLISGDSVKWLTVRPGQDNSVLWGNPRTGAYGRFNRFAAGFEDRPHFHTRDLRVVIVSGTMIVRIAGGAPVELGAGSYALIPAGSPHTHSCKGGSACVLFVEQDGPNDTTPVQEK
jgi:mannose-6-phosphate isomerase-like protein (cupin superfamily)